MSDTLVPQNSLYERYASREMAGIFTSRHRYDTWRELWIALAECQHELGLPISEEQLQQLREAKPYLDFDRVAEIEAETRHDVVAHLRHFAEQAGVGGGILHLGATSAFITDNTDLILARQALTLIEKRLVAGCASLSRFAHATKSIPTLAFTHFQPAQLTTVGKRSCLWLQDWIIDLNEIRRLIAGLRCRGAKGTTGTQASYLALFAGDHQKVRHLDRLLARKLGFAEALPITGQTYTRKIDSQILAALSGIGESCHKMGTDLRLLQGLGELAEPFGTKQVGSSAMAYKRNPIRAERMCALARRLIIDALNGPWTTAVQWLERSLDDSANRRLVIPEAFLLADAILSLAGGICEGLSVNEEVIHSHVMRELPFMATENLLMQATVRGGDRQELHERIRQHSMTAHTEVQRGNPNPLIDLLMSDAAFDLDRAEVEATVDPAQFIGRAPEQVDEFLAEVVAPTLADAESAPIEEPRV